MPEATAALYPFSANYSLLASDRYVYGESRPLDRWLTFSTLHFQDPQKPLPLEIRSVNLHSVNTTNQIREHFKYEMERGHPGVVAQSGAEG